MTPRGQQAQFALKNKISTSFLVDVFLKHRQRKCQLAVASVSFSLADKKAVLFLGQTKENMASPQKAFVDATNDAKVKFNKSQVENFGPEKLSEKQDGNC